MDYFKLKDDPNLNRRKNTSQVDYEGDYYKVSDDSNPNNTWAILIGFEDGYWGIHEYSHWYMKAN